MATTSKAASVEPAATTGTEQSSQPVQMELFADKILSESARQRFELIGQIFDTYWLISYEDKLLIIDQHAAHEKIKYERLLKHFRRHAIVSQTMNPPIVVTMTGKERECYLKHAGDFEALGFTIEEFGGSEYALRGVPMDLYGYDAKTFFSGNTGRTGGGNRGRYTGEYPDPYRSHGL